jgi:hypothetical protein
MTFFASIQESLSVISFMPILDGLSLMGAWTIGGMGGGGTGIGGGERRDSDKEESMEVGTTEPGGPEVITDNPDRAR